MNEARAIARCEEAAALLPPRFRRAALQMPDHRKRYTEEFRLRAGQPPAALLPEGEVMEQLCQPYSQEVLGKDQCDHKPQKNNQ